MFVCVWVFVCVAVIHPLCAPSILVCSRRAEHWPTGVKGRGQVEVSQADRPLAYGGETNEMLALMWAALWNQHCRRGEAQLRDAQPPLNHARRCSSWCDGEGVDFCETGQRDSVQRKGGEREVSCSNLEASVDTSCIHTGRRHVSTQYQFLVIMWRFF